MEIDPVTEIPILAIKVWPSNAELIADCARLGYLRKEWRTLDPTYGYGTFWNAWRPNTLFGTDLDPEKTMPTLRKMYPEGVDFTDLPWSEAFFDAVVFDPPYKLNGTPTEMVDERYGVHKVATWRDRMKLIEDGLTECSRVLKAGGYLLLKCQDQVCSGKIRWQTIEFTIHARTLGLGLVDRFDFLSYRAQPAGTRQVHARRNASTLLVFKQGWNSR